MSSKNVAPKQCEKKTSSPLAVASLSQFKKDGTGLHIQDELVNDFPLFQGKAPAMHPYPQAFAEGATDEEYCYVERIDDDLVLLRRELPSGRIIDIDTNDFDMLNDGIGIVHLNMNNGDNRIENLMWVKESQARKMLMEFQEI